MDLRLGESHMPDLRGRSSLEENHIHNLVSTSCGLGPMRTETNMAERTRADRSIFNLSRWDGIRTQPNRVRFWSGTQLSKESNR